MKYKQLLNTYCLDSSFDQIKPWKGFRFIKNSFDMLVLVVLSLLGIKVPLSLSFS